jgi:hypothetical protein
MFYEASYAKKLLAGLSYQAFQADSILRQQLLRIERERKKGQAHTVILEYFNVILPSTLSRYSSAHKTKIIFQVL